MLSSYDIEMLCTPAWLYLMLSIVFVLVAAVQNVYMFSSQYYHVGQVKCKVPHVLLVFLLKALVVLFWTWALDMICKSGHPDISWVLLFLPAVFFLSALSTALMVGLAEIK